jgi:adenine-specific DNA-methyltransferase
MKSISTQLDTVLHGDCIDAMRGLPGGIADFILTDPPYITRYQDRSGRRVINDDNDRWLEPAVQQMFRVLKDDAFCVSFYGWNSAERFLKAWRSAGFRIVGHIVFRKSYASSIRFLQRQHEAAYLLVKGEASQPRFPISDVIDWTYEGNALHPTQKPVHVLKPLIKSFCPQGGVVLDPFCGSGSTLVAAQEAGRKFIGIEIDVAYCDAARRRVAPVPARIAA